MNGPAKRRLFPGLEISAQAAGIHFAWSRRMRKDLGPKGDQYGLIKEYTLNHMGIPDMI